MGANMKQEVASARGVALALIILVELAVDGMVFGWERGTASASRTRCVEVGRRPPNAQASHQRENMP